MTTWNRGKKQTNNEQMNKPDSRCSSCSLLYCNQIFTEDVYKNISVDPRENFKASKISINSWEKAFWVAVVSLQTSTDLSKSFLKEWRRFPWQVRGRVKKEEKVLRNLPCHQWSHLMSELTFYSHLPWSPKKQSIALFRLKNQILEVTTSKFYSVSGAKCF